MANSTKAPEQDTVAEDDALLPTGPEPDSDRADADALARLAAVTPPNADAFVDNDEEDDDETDDIAAAIRAEPTREPHPDAPADEGSFEPIPLGEAALQDLKISAHSNGNNYDLTFEVGIDMLDKLVKAATGGHDVTWKKFHIGSGAEVRRAGVSRDADGGLHLKIVVRLPESEISRSIGRIGPLVRSRGTLLLEPQQGKLGLGGKLVDLSARAK